MNNLKSLQKENQMIMKRMIRKIKSNNQNKRKRRRKIKRKRNGEKKRKYLQILMMIGRIKLNNLKFCKIQIYLNILKRSMLFMKIIHL
ncbi:unnamed protein product [Paramecium pentaurelia]|uniref:Uncharacterized protein n=1 Tax=Paramecium pentaurelia TaxID=43138 RepID=A0A8S1WMJ0_9CILI|nr:unnamed protein product [Paramecium pentaurelia]